ncbi:hypothetical protein KCU62_g2479, partial [Aureobasidium sp. EXF-3399]
MPRLGISVASETPDSRQVLEIAFHQFFHCSRVELAAALSPHALLLTASAVEEAYWEIAVPWVLTKISSIDEEKAETRLLPMLNILLEADED